MNCQVIPSLMLAASVSALSSGAAAAAVLDSFAGPFTVSEGSGATVVDTSSDTGDWLDNYNDATDAGTLYYRFDINVINNTGETGAGGFFTALQLFSGGGERLGVGNSWNATDYGYFGGFGGEGSLAPSQPITVGQTESFVVRIDFVNGGDDTATIYFNPIDGLGEGSQAIAATTTADFGFDNVVARAGNGTAEVTYSNVAFATEFGDLVNVPEPGSLALSALGGLVMLRRRR